MKIVNFRVDDNEHQLMHAIAESKGMSLSGYIKHHFRTIAIQEKLIDDPLDALRPQNKQPATPQIVRKPIPTEPNAWRDEIYTRVKDGEDIKTIADSYGTSVDIVRQKVQAAKFEEKVGAAPTHTQTQPQPPLPEYNPVDPDNPTLDEQKVNAERARLQLESMGFNV